MIAQVLYSSQSSLPWRRISSRKSRLLTSAALSLVLAAGSVSFALADGSGGMGAGPAGGAGGVAGTNGGAGGNATASPTGGGGGGGGGAAGASGGNAGYTTGNFANGGNGNGGDPGNNGQNGEGGASVNPTSSYNETFHASGGGGGGGGVGGGGGGGGSGGLSTADGDSSGRAAAVFGFGGVAGSATGDGGAGGAGGSASAGAISNTSAATATTTGGNGGSGGGGGAGGAGSTAPGSAVMGGMGGVGGAGGRASANAISDSAATATATAVGGNGGNGGAGGAGFVLSGSATPYSLTSTITGGNGGTGGAGGGNLANAAQTPSYNSIADGATASGSNSSSSVTGGNAGNGGNGGIGVVLGDPGATVSNTMAIGGGAGGAGGGGGSAFISAGNTLTGGAGIGGAGANGGTGMSFTAPGGALTNTGSVTGGAGGNGGLGGAFANLPAMTGSGATGGAGGNGGIGLVLTGPNASLVNRGSIVGGNGGAGGAGGADTLFPTRFGGPPTVTFPAGANGAAGSGGVGVLASGVTIDNAGGTISGGFATTTVAQLPALGAAAPAAAPVGAGAQAYAIEFTGGTNYVGTGGTIDGGIYVAGGSFQPQLNANPVGTPLAIATGPLVFASGTSFNIRITPTATDSVYVATGGATLNGAAVNVAAGAGTYSARRYTILTATGGVAGTFSGVTTNLAFLAPTLSYDADDVFLTLTASGNYVPAGLTLNQRAVGHGLTNAARVTGTGPILNAVNQLTVPQVPPTFDSLSGEGIAAAQNAAFRSTDLFVSSIFDQTTFYGDDCGTANAITLTAPQPGRPQAFGLPCGQRPIRELADLPAAAVPAPIVAPQRTWRAWATGWGGYESIQGNAFPIGSANQTLSIYGGTLGVDYQLMPNYLAGVAIGGSDGEFNVAGRGTSGSTTGGHVAFYDLATFGAFYAASTTSASFYGNQTTRTIAGFGGLGGETERGNFQSNNYGTKVEFGRHFAAYGGLVTPFVSLSLNELRSYGFTETPLAGPGLFALNVQGQDTASVPSLIGARFQTIMPLGNGMVLSPTLQLAWEHEFSPVRPLLAGLVNLPGAVFLTDGARPARDSAAVKAGGELAITQHAALFANFEGDFSGIDQFYAGKGGFRYVW